MEAVARKDKAEKKFADSLCEQISYCVPWMDPAEKHEQKAQKEMEIVFE